MSWTTPPTGMARQNRSKANQWLRATALQALVGVDERSPVDKGAFRGNNHVSVAEPDDSFDEDRLDPSGASTISEGQQVILRVTGPFEVIYIQNNLPYAVPLEEGSSDQAPQGVFQVTFDSLNEAGR